MSAWRKTVMAKAEDALKGRAEGIPVAPKHLVLGTPMLPPFPTRLEAAVFGLGCFWGAERKFWQATGVYSTAVGYAGGFTPNPTYEEVCSGLTGHTEVVLVVFDPGVVPFDRLLKIFWESHDPTQGMRQGGDTGTQVPVGDLRPFRGAVDRRAREPRCLSGGADGGRIRANHHGDRPGRRVLLRGGLPPAVPREEPERVLRVGRDGSGVSGWIEHLTHASSQ